MVPSAFVSLAAFPLSANGKVDRAALPSPELKQSVAEDASASLPEPKDDVEQQLTAIWERVLEVRPVGRNDNFFDLGGHSLTGIRLFVQIERRFGRKLSLGSLFQAPTIAQLGALLRESLPPRENVA